MKKLENIFWVVVFGIAIYVTVIDTLKYRQLRKNYVQLVKNQNDLQEVTVKLLNTQKEKDSLLFEFNYKFAEHLLFQTRLIKEKIK